MKTKNPYSFLNTYCLRTPIQSLSFYRKVITQNEITDKELDIIWNNSITQEAIFLASPELFFEIEKWYNDDFIIGNKDTLRLKASLLKYFSRMTSRCTPFGLFAGCSVGTFSKNTSIEIGLFSKHERQTRFDMHFLVSLSKELSKDEIIKKQLYWYPNSSLYQIGKQYRYVEYQYSKENKREYSIQAVSDSSHLKSVLEKAKNGATISQLSEILIDDEITKEDSGDFINKLIDNQILVSNIEPSISGQDFLERLYEKINILEGTENYKQQLNYFIQSLTDIDKTIGNSYNQYLQLTREVKKIKIRYDQKHLYQTDLYPNIIDNQLDKKWGYKFNHLMSLLNKITPNYKDVNLERFKKKFTERYETREIPLATALDTEIGIGYIRNQEVSDSTPFLKGIDIPYENKATQKTFLWNRISETLYDKIEQIKYTRALTIEIEDKDFNSFKEYWNDLPDTMSTIAELVITEGKEKMVISSIGGASATDLLGRFTTGNNELRKFSKEVANFEKQMNLNHILADIIHLPESRIGNIIQRATLRDYDIPYLGKSNLPLDQQIDINDLMVSVQNNTVYLRSKRLNKLILPRLSNAHNYSNNSLPIYHFLCDLQYQGLRPSIGFHWDAILEKNKFLPRVVYKDFILSKARWIIRKGEIAEFLTMSKDEVLNKVNSWRKNIQLPSLVQLVDGDNTLLINLDNYDIVKMWLETVKKREAFVLEEFLFSEECVVKRESEEFTNQVIISFYNEMKLKKAKIQRETNVKKKGL